MYFFPEESWINWVDTLSKDDYVVIDDFLSEAVYSTIRAHFLEKMEEDRFQRAGIGALGNNMIERSIRGDFTYWLEKERDLALSTYFSLIEEVMFVMRRYCFLPISDGEFHYAYYPPGTHYEAHVDQFSERNNRLISMVIYLNEGWQPGDGGELKIFRPNGEDIVIEPIKKRCILFRSDTVLHQVLPTHVDRYSLTGWLLKNPVGVGFI